MSLLERFSFEDVQVGLRGLRRLKPAIGEVDPHLALCAASGDSAAPVSACAGQLIKVADLVKSNGARIIGITGMAPGVGASTVSLQLAHIFASFGRRTLLVDVSKVASLPVEASTPVQEAQLAESATFISGNVGLVDLLGIPSGTPNEHALRTMLAVAAEQGLTIVVDLPPVLEANDRPSPALVAVGALCDMTFLVCLTGAVTGGELNRCVVTSRVAGVNLAGLILNDWQLLLSGLLPS